MNPLQRYISKWHVLKMNVISCNFTVYNFQYTIYRTPSNMRLHKVSLFLFVDIFMRSNKTLMKYYDCVMNTFSSVIREILHLLLRCLKAIYQL